jgi:MFS family permease
MKLREISFVEGFFYSLMVGLGETFLVAYALTLGISEGLSSLIACIPIMIGSILQIPIGKYFRRFNERRCLVFFSAFQGCCLFFLALPTLMGASSKIGHIYLTMLLAFYWTCSFAAGPIWNRYIVALLGDMDLRSFFFQRNAVCQCAAILALIGAAFALGDGRSTGGHSAYTLAVLIFSAGLARLGSSFAFSRHKLIANVLPEGERKVFAIWSLMKSKYVKPAILLLFLTNFGVNISGPFFNSYQLSELGLTFVQFNTLVGIGFASRIASTYFFNNIVKRMGVKVLLIIGAFGIVPLPALWTFSDNFIWLCVLQVASGIAWSCHELGITLILIEKVPQGTRTNLLAWANLINTLGISIGVGFAIGLVGGGDLSRESYYQLFWASTLARILPLFILPFVVDVRARPLMFRSLSLFAFARGINKPILLPDEQSTKN